MSERQGMAVASAIGWVIVCIILGWMLTALILAGRAEEYIPGVPVTPYCEPILNTVNEVEAANKEIPHSLQEFKGDQLKTLEGVVGVVLPGPELDTVVAQADHAYVVITSPEIPDDQHPRVVIFWARGECGAGYITSMLRSVFFSAVVEYAKKEQTF